MPDFTDISTPTIAFDGTQSIEEIVEAHPGVPMIAKGKLAIQDIGRRMAQMRGLKPGSTSIRTVEMIDEILERLTDGETLTSILLDDHMPARRTLDGWCDKDEELGTAIVKAMASGQHVLADIRLDIAQRGIFSTQDARYDEMLIKAINANIAQRNRRDFGEHKHVDMTVSTPTVMLAPLDLPEIDDSEFDDATFEVIDQEDDPDQA